MEFLFKISNPKSAKLTNPGQNRAKWENPTHPKNKNIFLSENAFMYFA
jgi:hypothetical protein